MLLMKYLLPLCAITVKVLSKSEYILLIIDSIDKKDSNKEIANLN